MVRRTYHEGAEGSWGKFHEVDGDDPPGALDAELFEKGRGYDFGVADVRVGVEDGAADDGDDNDGEAPAEDLRAVADDRAACHGAEVGDDLGDGDGVSGELVLILQHERIEVLGTVGHEVESGHEEDKVDKEEPVLLNGDAAFGEEGAG